MTTNGNRILGRGVFAKALDERNSNVRRIRALVKEYTNALGGEGRMNVGDQQTIQRLAALIVLVELQERMLVKGDPKYNPDEHMRNVGKIKILQDDLDLPKKSRSTPTSGFDPDPDTTPEFDDDDRTLEEYCADELAAGRGPKQSYNLDKLFGTEKRKRKPKRARVRL